MTLYWPNTVLKAQSVGAPFLAPRTMSGAAALSGRTQVSSTDAGVWFYSMKSIPVHDRNTVLTWRAVDALLEGRLTPINVPLMGYELNFAPYAVDLDYTSLLAPVPYSDDAYFSDGSGFVGGIASVSTTGSAALRATSFTVSVGYAPTLQPGMIFSIVHPTKGNRWYKVKSFNEDTGSMTFRPPLREAISSLTILNFDTPTCRMRLASDTEMTLDLQAPTLGFPSVSFVEDL